jgi:hypothetical protein
MTRATYDIYDLNSPAFVEPTAPATTATTTRRSSDRLMRGSVYLLLLAGAFLLAAFLLAASPLSRWDVDLTVPFLAALVGGIGAVGWAVARP